MIHRRHPAIVLLVFLWVASPEASLAASALGESDCASLLAQAENPSAEPALVAAVMGLLAPLEQSKTHGILEWYRKTIEQYRSQGPGTTRPLHLPELADSEINEAFEGLAALIEGLEASGQFDRTRFTALLVEAFQSRLNEEDAARGAGAAAADSRGTAAAAVRTIVVGSEVRQPPVELASGGLVVVGRLGEVVFFSPDGSVLASHHAPDVIELSPVPLRDGGALVLLLDGTILNFGSDGSLRNRIPGPRLGSMSLPLVLRDGGIVVFGERGDTLFLSHDGSVRRRFDTKLWVSMPPIQLADGAILLGTVTGEIVRMNLNGEWKIQHEMGSGAAAAPVQLRDRTVVISDNREVIHFLNPDGTPKKKWRIRNVTFKGREKNDDFALLALPDGRVAASSWHQFVILDPDGAVFHESRRKARDEHPPLLLEDGSLLVEHADGKFWRFSGPSWRKSGLLAIDGHLSAPLSSLGGGWIASPGTDHRLRIFEVDFRGGRIVHDFAAGTDLRCRVIRLRNGLIAVGDDSGRLLLLDPAQLDAL